MDLPSRYGAALTGTAHPAIVEAVRSQVALGAHFASPTEDALTVGGRLAQQFRLPL